jgi:zinc protease
MLKSLLFLLCIGCSLQIHAAGNTHETVLPNGLKVLVRQDHRAPVALTQLWYRVGSMDEPAGKSGLSHMLEHMMFRGTRKVPDQVFSRRIAAVGGEDNAGTWRDYTFYYTKLPARHLELAFQLEADRMNGLQLTDKLLQIERENVHEERRWRTDDDPDGRLYERFNSIAWLAHPYRVPVIGWADDVRHWSLKDLQTWYRQWYAPNNAVLIVVGDVDPKHVFRLARQYFGPKRPVVLPERRMVSEPEIDGPRRIVTRAPAELGALMFGFPVPALRQIEQDQDPYALELLATILSGHAASRFAVELEQTGKVQGVWAHYDAIGRGPGLFTLGGSLKPGQDIADLEQLLWKEIQKIQQEGVSTTELERARRQYRAARVYAQDSAYAQARELGELEMAGFSWRDAARIDARLQQVDVASIQAVARRYLRPERQVSAELDPLPLEAKTLAPRKGLHHAR